MGDDPGSAGRATRVQATVRSYRVGDREEVREICRRTAFRNLGYQAVFEDGELFADYWTRYYTDFEPESAWVAEQDGRVMGYLLGCLDTRRQIRITAWRIVPPLLVRLLWRWATGRYRVPVTHRFLRWLWRKSWREAPPLPLRAFPAHYHCNILVDGYRQNLYTRLALLFLDHAARRGVRGVHGSVLDPQQKGVWQRMVQRFNQEHPGEITHAERPTEFYRDVLAVDEPMVHRAYGGTVERYRRFIEWMAGRYQL